jgi:hypothetical protein
MVAAHVESRQVWRVRRTYRGVASKDSQARGIQTAAASNADQAGAGAGGGWEICALTAPRIIFSTAVDSGRLGTRSMTVVAGAGGAGRSTLTTPSHDVREPARVR